jgi:Holliday junction resolvasome RuvABC endonuclease subunit
LKNILKEIFEKEKPDAICVEGTFWELKGSTRQQLCKYGYRNNNNDCMEVLHIELCKIQPSTVKKLVTGNGRAKKGEVAEAVKEKFNITDNLADHITDSIAIGYAFLLQQNKKEVM